MENRPRILYLITLPDIGGAQNHVLDLLEGFGDSYEVHLATSASGPLTAAAAARGVPVHLLPSLGRAVNPRGDLGAIRECRALIRTLGPALVHAHSSKAGLVGRLAARSLGVPAVFTAHGWGFSPGVRFAQRWIVWACEVAAAPLSSRIICVSHADRRLARRSLIGARTTTIHYGITPEAPRATGDGDPLTILMAARFHEQKDQQLLLRAFAAINPPNARLVFVGGGHKLPQSQALAVELGIADRALFLGDRHDVPELLARADIFALTTRYEGLPISILEAMRAGLPVVASAVAGVPEEVEHGVTGFVAPRGDVAGIAAGLAQLIVDPALRRRMGQAGRRKFEAEFTRARMLAAIEAVYRELLPVCPRPGVTTS